MLYLDIVLWWAIVFSRSTRLFDNRYISAKRFETDQVMNVFALIAGEMYPVGLCLHILPDVSLCDKSRFLVGPRSVMLGSVRFLFERTKQAGFRSRKLWNRQAH